MRNHDCLKCGIGQAILLHTAGKMGSADGNRIADADANTNRNPNTNSNTNTTMGSNRMRGD